MRRCASYYMLLACAAVLPVAAHPVGAQVPARSPSAAVSYTAPPGAPYTAEDVIIRSPYGHTLGGTLTLPCRARGPFPTVVLISGTGPQDRDGGVPGDDYRPLRQIADTLSRRGIAVLRFDDRGVATGNYFSPASPLEVAEDVRAALMLLRARGDIDPARLALVGHSEGGLVATMIAASDPSLRAAVGATRSPSENFDRGFARTRPNRSGARHQPQDDSTARLGAARSRGGPGDAIAPAVGSADRIVQPNHHRASRSHHVCTRAPGSH